MHISRSFWQSERERESRVIKYWTGDIMLTVRESISSWQICIPRVNKTTASENWSSLQTRVCAKWYAGT